jgi:hypothetical protein
MFNDITLYGSWAVGTWFVYLWVYTWQMVKPVTDHPNWVRKLVRKVTSPSVWKIIFCRPVYKKSIQNNSFVWFIFFVLMISYALFSGVYLVELFVENHPDDNLIRILMLILIISTVYVCIASIALEVIIMLIVMVVMTISIVLCIGCIIWCPRFLAWRPERDNDRINRNYFNGIVRGEATWEEILQFLYKFKRRHFKKYRYKTDLIVEEIEKTHVKIEEEKEPNMIKNADGMWQNSDKNEETYRSADKMQTYIPSSTKVAPEMTTKNESKLQHYRSF